uniref:Glycosyltransferase 2-like domain-containing protein n=1 Tax=Xiphophorus couchianus TaxID=32473 RepID=A0A3B5ML81_9TELE
MRRKEKRLLQFSGLLIAALLFLPNVGLWSLYRDRVVGKDARVGRDGVRRKDWHDYETIRRDATRSGNGEQGKPFPLTDADRVDQAYRENGFNIYVSDRISLNRSVPDIRHPNCKKKLYSEKLPNTSIIIPFHNEGWSSLLRTVHSILNRSPPELIAEIILVDDFSDKGTHGIQNTQTCPHRLSLAQLPLLGSDANVCIFTGPCLLFSYLLLCIQTSAHAHNTNH